MTHNFKDAEPHIRKFAGEQMMSGEMNVIEIMGQIMDGYEDKGIKLTAEEIEISSIWILQGMADYMRN